ncbi:MAG TPA: hypothetical protein VGI95_11105 [Caulobacteraceae bacterium]|jgi:hypothetical protein
MANDRIEGEQGQQRGVGAALIACAVASVGLLMAHPSGGASHELADVLKAEAAQALPDAIVHGGYVLVLAVELVGFLGLATRIGTRRPAVLAALVFAVVGAALLAASMIADGLITPAIATRYAPAPAAKQEGARAILVLIGAAINVLMPMGLAFQGAAAVAWSTALMRKARIAGLAALALGVAVLVAAWFSLDPAGMPGLLAALIATAVWTLIAGVLLWRGGQASA